MLPRYYEKEMLYQDSLISVLPLARHYTITGKEKIYIVTSGTPKRKKYYQKALEGVPVNVRLYAMVTYGLALVYSKLGDWNEYEHYLIKAAISDQVCPLKENLALQELALYIFKTEVGKYPVPIAI